MCSRLRVPGPHAKRVPRRSRGGARRLPGGRRDAGGVRAQGAGAPRRARERALDRSRPPAPAFLLLGDRRERRCVPAPAPGRRPGVVAGLGDGGGLMRSAILHVDIDAFFAAIEQQRDPRLKGRPVIVGAGVIASCSYEARAFGLRAGMRLSDARRLCPQAVILEGHAQVYRCYAEEIFARCRALAPAVETYLDEAYCDLTGTERL